MNMNNEQIKADFFRSKNRIRINQKIVMISTDEKSGKNKSRNGTSFILSVKMKRTGKVAKKK